MTEHLQISTTAPAKVFLTGEHAVVYGCPAILMSVGLYTSFSIQSDSGTVVTYEEQTFHINELQILAKHLEDVYTKSLKDQDFSGLKKLQKEVPDFFLRSAFAYLTDKFSIEHGVKLTAKSDIPIGAGLGSSASFAVALTALFAEYSQQELSLKEINAIAFELEKYNHITPSGADNTVCTYGGIVSYQKTPAGPKIKMLDDLDLDLNNFLLVEVEKPKASTAELVTAVAALPSRRREQAFAIISESVEPLMQALQQKKSLQILDCLNQTHQALASLDVSTKNLNLLHSEVKKLGGGSKLCGAGGGGVMLCYHEDIRGLNEELQKHEYITHLVEFGVAGVKI